jgi:hypothetical protein
VPEVLEEIKVLKLGIVLKDENVVNREVRLAEDRVCLEPVGVVRVEETQWVVGPFHVFFMRIEFWHCVELNSCLLVGVSLAFVVFAADITSFEDGLERHQLLTDDP